MKLTTLDKIVHVKVDHGSGSLVNSDTGKKVQLGDFRIVYARYGRKMFQQDGAGSWSLLCSSGDAITGHPRGEEAAPCQSLSICTDCKPSLMVGVLTVSGTQAVLELSATAARSFNEMLTRWEKGPEPIFRELLKLHLMQTQKSTGMSYTQLALRTAGTGEMPSGEKIADLLQVRETLKRVIDQRMDRTPGGARPNLAGATLKM